MPGTKKLFEYILFLQQKDKETVEFIPLFLQGSAYSLPLLNDKLKDIASYFTDESVYAEDEENHVYHSDYLRCVNCLKNKKAGVDIEYLESLSALGLYRFSLLGYLHFFHTNNNQHPDYALHCHNISLYLLRLGYYELGWKLAEMRFSNPRYLWPSREIFNHLDVAIWQGQSFNDGYLLVFVEQGIGDYLQFIRFVLKLNDLGIKVAIQNIEPLHSLMSFNFHKLGIKILNNEEEVPPISYKIALLSLPFILGTQLDSIPYASKYLDAPSNHKTTWQAKIQNTHKQLKIGLVFEGSKEHAKNNARSILFQKIMALFSLNAEFHLLQKELSSENRIRVEKINNLLLWDQEINDFADTSALIDCMDLVISVDTSVAHLSAAMGKKTWVLLANSPDFRWLTDRKDSLWYESVTLFRQSIRHDWQEVIDDVYEKLKKVIIKRFSE